MGVSKYREKRDFSKTPEPSPKKASKHSVLSFVVQRHEATRLHYDFRLELEGVLKSWAVPKGPSMVAGEKRLAVMVEDHPLEYVKFRGKIPEGNYGAGIVDIWDKGTYKPYKAPENIDQEIHLLNQLEKGDMKINLEGKHLTGAFALVRLKGGNENNWLLIKKNDGHNLLEFDIESIKPIKPASRVNKKSSDKKKTPTQSHIESIWNKLNKPMLASTTSNIPDKPDWIYEIKYDGYRAISLIDNNKVKLISRNGNDFTQQFKSLVEELKTINDQVIIDGEIVIENKKGISDFQKLQNYLIKQSREKVKYYVFDILFLNDHQTIKLPLVSRKELLASLFEKYKLKNIIKTSYQIGEGKLLYTKLFRDSYEGIIAKSPYSYYSPGKRSKSWLKIKSINTIEAIICGYTLPKNSRKYSEALLLGKHDQGHINYIGSCETGLNEKMHKELFYRLNTLMIENSPFDKGPDKLKDKAVWVKPELICCVKFLAWTKNNILRSPVFQGIKEDLEFRESMIKKTVSIGETSENQKILTFGRKSLKVTNLGKVYWPDEGITKGDLIDYYGKVSDFILPYLKNRPQSLNRFPNGIKGPSFYQKDMDVSQVPKWAKTVKMYSKSNDEEIDYLICNDKATLLYMANLGCIEINPWHSIYSHPDNPDYVMLDLDPGNISFKEVVKTAIFIKNLCEELQIDSYCKTSGATGLHIFIPLGAKYDYGEVKHFAEILASITNNRLPEITSIERMTSKRKDKVYVDFLQNRKGQTIAAPYSVRPRPGATVSTPLKWEEVNEELDPGKFNIFNTEKRLESVGDLWQGVLSKPVNIMKVLRKIEKFNS